MKLIYLFYKGLSSSFEEEEGLETFTARFRKN